MWHKTLFISFYSLFVCFDSFLQFYLQINERICIQILPEVCPGPGTDPLNCGDDPDLHPDHMDLHETFTRGVSRTKEQSANFDRLLVLIESGILYLYLYITWQYALVCYRATGVT